MQIKVLLGGGLDESLIINTHRRQTGILGLNSPTSFTLLFVSNSRLRLSVLNMTIVEVCGQRVIFKRARSKTNR